MSGQRYERVPTETGDGAAPQLTPASPPPSFHSRTSSRLSDPSRRLLPSASTGDGRDGDGRDGDGADQERMLAETFDDAAADDDDDEDGGGGGGGGGGALPGPSDYAGHNAGHNAGQKKTGAAAAPTAYSNDGVFANLSAKPGVGGEDEVDEKPPTYEQAAADATPPYWETTILAPGLGSDDVYVDGLPVGSVFSFVWNGLISTSFQLVGFLLTYLLHTTHAAKHGSRAGLGITMIQYGFSIRSPSSASQPKHGDSTAAVAAAAAAGAHDGALPPDPNAHDSFTLASLEMPNSAAAASASRAMTAIDWFAYALMIVGWLVLIRALSDFLRARRHEQLVRQSPARGLSVPIIVEGQPPELNV